jgi:hypothetical protein
LRIKEQETSLTLNDDNDDDDEDDDKSAECRSRKYIQGIGISLETYRMIVK